MIRVWLSGIGISLAAHLAVATVLVLALEPHPAGQQPETGTRLNVSAVGVPHARAVPRALPAVALRPLPASGPEARLLALAPPVAPERAPGARRASARAPEALAQRGGAPAAAPLAPLLSAGRPEHARPPGSEALPAAPAPATALAAAEPGAARRAARSPGEARARALPAAGLGRVAATAPGDRLRARAATAQMLAPRPAAEVPAAERPLRLSALRGAPPEAHLSPAKALPARETSTSGSGAETRLAMLPAETRSDARPLTLVAVAAPDTPERRVRGGSLASAPAMPPRTATPRPLAPAEPESRPAPPHPLAAASARAPKAPAAEIAPRQLPSRAARQLTVAAQPARDLPPAAPSRPARALWSGGRAPDPASLAALGALTGGGGGDARAEIARILAEPPCARVQARLEPDGPRLVLRGHVPDLRTAAALLAALRGPLGGDIAATSELSTLPRPLCAQVAATAALGLEPREPDAALGAVVQGEGLLDAAAGSLRLPAGRGGFVHLDLYRADGEVVHLLPEPGTRPARHGPGESLRLEMPERAGQGRAVMVLLFTSRPLYLWPRPAREPAAIYLRFLANQAAAMREAGGVSGLWRYAILPEVPEDG